jgi:hypothetical protein
MRKLRPKSEESLDLLLDTLCNVFGGIILISCLLALLTSNQPLRKKDDGTNSALGGKFLAERLQAATKELEGLKAILAKVKAQGDDDLQKLLVERDQLRTTQSRLRQTAAVDPVNDNSNNDPVGDLAKLRNEVKALDLKLADAKARTQAASAKERDLASRLQRLKTQIDETEAKRVEYVRFPREHTASKSSFSIILKYGEVFPLYLGDGRAFEGITRVPSGGKSFTPVPKKAEGWDAVNDRAAILETLASCKQGGAYIAIYVYPDSFDTFRSIKEFILSSGLEYGFEVWPEHYKSRFGPNGSSPSPL